MHIIRFEFMRSVFSQIEQIGALRFVAAFLMFCLFFVGVNTDLVVNVGPGFVLIIANRRRSSQLFSKFMMMLPMQAFYPRLH